MPMSRRIESLSFDDWPRYARQIMQLEEAAFEPGRRETEAYFQRLMADSRSLSLVMIEDDQLLGLCLGARLEMFPDLPWARDDPEWNRSTTMYAADLAVAARHRNRGIGWELKQRQVAGARKMGYRYITGRNRLGMAAAMLHMNQKLGAYERKHLKDSYTDELGAPDGIYYRIDL